LLTKSLAIKIARPTGWTHFLHGLLSNLQERTFAKTGWPELCPVLFADPLGLIVIMPRAVPLTSWDELPYVEGFVHKEDYSLPVEIKLDSFGWLKGKIVAIDYGS
jgi:hypothetical protein